MVVQSNLYVHTKYENMDKIYLYPIWEFFRMSTCSQITCSLKISRKTSPPLEGLIATTTSSSGVLKVQSQ